MTRRHKHKYLIIKKYLSKRCRGIRFIGTGMLCVGVNGQFILTEIGKHFIRETEPEPMVLRLQGIPNLKQHSVTLSIQESKHEAKEYRNRMNYAKFQKYRK